MKPEFYATELLNFFTHGCLGKENALLPQKSLLSLASPVLIRKWRVYVLQVQQKFHTLKLMLRSLVSQTLPLQSEMDKGPLGVGRMPK